jgi:uncharacterized protein (TIGR00730 family)
VTTRTVAVFCASGPGTPEVRAEVTALAARLAGEEVRLVYGGGSRGLMGVMLEAFTARSRDVVAVCAPGVIAAEAVALPSVRVLEKETIAERVATMADLADAFLVAPGGLGTLEEFTVVASGAQLGVHGKPVVLFDALGYWEPLREQLRRAEEVFGYTDVLSAFTVATAADEAVRAVLAGPVPAAD